jgi:hypothetical protein
MVRSPRYGFIQFTALPSQGCCPALPVSDISELAFYVYAEFEFKLGVQNSTGQVTQDAAQTIYDSLGSWVNGGDVGIELASVLRCGECFHLVLLEGNTVRATSNTFQYICDTEYTSVVRYLLHAPGFEWDYPLSANSVRLPLYLTEPQYPQEQEVYRQKSGYRRHLFAEIEKTYNLKTDFLPDELHEKLVIALSHDEVYIDDLLLTKSESYNIDWGNTEIIDGVKYAMASAVMVENVTARNDNCGGVLSVETVEFFDYVCRTTAGTSERDGMAYARLARYFYSENGEAVKDITKSLITDVTPVITENDYLALSSSGVESRAIALLDVFGATGYVKYLTHPVAYIESCHSVKGIFLWSSYVCQRSGSDVVPTNVQTGEFACSALGQDGKLYFGSSDNRGIWRLEDSGEIVQTNKTSGSFAFAYRGWGSSEELYFGSSDGSGIWKLNGSGVIVQTNVTSGSFACAVKGYDDAVYFGSSSNAGIWKKTQNDSVIAQTNKTSGSFTCAIFHSESVYFGSSNGSGIWSSRNGADVAQTNVTSGSFACAGDDLSGVYFGSSDNTGVWRLLYTEGIASIVQTNKQTGSFRFAVADSGGRLYLGASSDGGGIYMVLRTDNSPNAPTQIVATNVTSGNFEAGALDGDGRLYFCGYSIGVWYLVNMYTIVQTDKTGGNFQSAGKGQDGYVYFGYYGVSVDNVKGIWRTSDVAINTGYAFGTNIRLKLYRGTLHFADRHYSVLSAFGGIPAIAEDDYELLSLASARLRGTSILEYIASDEGLFSYTEDTEQVKFDVASCPIG